MLAHNHLAAIDHNHHLHRNQARDSNGQLVFSRRWSKHAKRWKVVIVKEKKNYSYLPITCASVLKNASKEYMKNVKLITSEQNPKKIAPTIAALPAPKTSELVKEHKVLTSKNYFPKQSLKKIMLMNPRCTILKTSLGI